MNGVFGFLIGFVLFVLIVLGILYHKSIKNFKKKLRQAADAREARKLAEEEEYFKRTSTKHYRAEEKPNFQKDYFKGAEEKPKKQTQSQSQSQQQKPKQEASTRRTVKTHDGVTIIDDRSNQKTDRKIFGDNEGEYVDFEEVQN